MAEETVQINLSRLQLKLVELQQIWESICTSKKAKKIFADGIPPLIITSQQIAIPLYNLTPAQQDFISKTTMEDEIKKVENSDEFKMNSISDMWRGETPIRFGKRGNEFVILNNKEEDPQGYDEIIHHLSALNGTLISAEIPEIEFDIIVGVFLHGIYEEKHDPSPEMMAESTAIGEQVQLDMYGKVGKVKTVKQGMYPVPVPSDLQTTFLDAVLCGITHTSYFIRLREQLRHLLSPMVRDRHVDLLFLQSELRKIKEEVVASPSFLSRPVTDETEKFRHHTGWNILTEGFLDKGYVKDDKVFGTPEITVFYSKPESKIPIEKKNVLDDILLGLKKTHMNIRGQQIEIYRSDLMDYLYKCGYRNPLIIDTSCGDLPGLDPRGSRKSAAEQLKTQTAGKKRSRKKIRKRYTRRITNLS
jgi:hypothetical protein